MDQMAEGGASVVFYMAPSSGDPEAPWEKLQTQTPTEVMQVTKLSKVG